jgi:hypothetical protein
VRLEIGTKKSSQESEAEDNDNYRSNPYVDDVAAEDHHGAAEDGANPMILDHVAPKNFSGIHQGSIGTLSDILLVDLENLLWVRLEIGKKRSTTVPSTIVPCKKRGIYPSDRVIHPMTTGIKLDLCFCTIPTVGFYGKQGEINATHN